MCVCPTSNCLTSMIASIVILLAIFVRYGSVPCFATKATARNELLLFSMAVPRLAAAEGHAKRRAWIFPTGHALVTAHDPAGTAFEASCVLEVNVTVLEAIASGGADHQARAQLARGADCLIHDDVWIAFVHLKSIQGQKLFWAQSFYGHMLRYAFHASAANWLKVRLLFIVC